MIRGVVFVTDNPRVGSGVLVHPNHQYGSPSVSIEFGACFESLRLIYPNDVFRAITCDFIHNNVAVPAITFW